MTTPPSAPITLDVVRERFVQAESSLNELTDALRSLRSSSERFDEARGGIHEASQRLVSLSDQFAAATQGVAGGIELLRKAIGVLEKSEPGQVLTALDQLDKVVRDVNVALNSSTEQLTQVLEAQATRLTDATAAIQKLSKELSDQRAAIGATRGELASGRKWMLAAIVGMGALIVVLQLVQLLR